MAGVYKCVLEVSPGPMDSEWCKLAWQLALVVRGGTSAVSVGYLWAGDEKELVLLSKSFRTVPWGQVMETQWLVFPVKRELYF